MIVVFFLFGILPIILAAVFLVAFLFSLKHRGLLYIGWIGVNDTNHDFEAPAWAVLGILTVVTSQTSAVYLLFR
jgi:hypothetical protein